MRDVSNSKYPCTECALGQPPNENNISHIPCTKCMTSGNCYFRRRDEEQRR